MRYSQTGQEGKDFWPRTQSHGFDFDRCHVHVRTETKSLGARPKHPIRSMSEGRCLPVPICARWALWGIALEPCRIKTGSFGMPHAAKRNHQTSLCRQCRILWRSLTVAHCIPGLLSCFAYRFLDKTTNTPTGAIRPTRCVKVQETPFEDVRMALPELGSDKRNFTASQDVSLFGNEPRKARSRDHWSITSSSIRLKSVRVHGTSPTQRNAIGASDFRRSGPQL